MTGPADCAVRDTCTLTWQGGAGRAVMLTRVGETHVVSVGGRGPCRLRWLAVGGGGTCGHHTWRGGAGSGWTVYQTVETGPGELVQAWVGGGGAASTVFTSSMNIQYAWAGEDAQDHAGGAGYCGGGGWAEGDTHSRAGSLHGGTDGGGGEGEGGGAGSGELVANYTFSAWRLQPGAGGGMIYSSDANQYHGGGGGGVMVSGAGPVLSPFQGRGYGGGGSGHAGYCEGLPGVILLEIVESDIES